MLLTKSLKVRRTWQARRTLAYAGRATALCRPLMVPNQSFNQIPMTELRKRRRKLR